MTALLTLILAVAGIGSDLRAQETAPVATTSSAERVLDDPLAFLRVDAEAGDLPLTVENVATGEIRRISGRRLLSGSQEMYLRSATAAGLFQASRFWQSALRRLDFKAAGKVFGLTGDSRLVVTPEGDLLLPVPVLDHDGDLWLPMVLLETVIGPQIAERLTWDAEAARLTLGTAEFNVTGLRARTVGRTTEVTISCSEPLGYRASSSRSGVIEVKIYGGQLKPGAVGLTRRRGLALGARSRQLRDDCLVTLRVDDLVSRYRTYTADEGRQIVLVLEEEQVSALPDPVPLGQQTVHVDTGPIDATHELSIHTVVIDPGHGGHDVGAVGRRGILEKDVNLAVARQLRRYLERESDLEVVLTRDRDEHLPLADRAEIANKAGGDLFISLHCNSWFNDGAQGLETYFLSPAQTDWARSVAEAENLAGGQPDDVEFIVWELVQNRFISSSSRLAEIVQEHTCDEAGLDDRGVRQAGFRVLVGAYMPAVLVEMGFLSHDDEERRLGNSSFQQRLARALGSALLEYRAQVDVSAVPEASVEDPDEDGGEGNEEERSE